VRKLEEQSSIGQPLLVGRLGMEWKDGESSDECARASPGTHNRQERPMLGPGALNILPCPSPSLRVTSPPPGAPLLRTSPSEAKHTSKPSRARAQLITSLVSPSARAIYISVRLAPHLKQTPRAERAAVAAAAINARQIGGRGRKGERGRASES